MSKMNFIERLLSGAIAKNISTRPKLGNYEIDIEYLCDGIIYKIIKKDMHIVTITKILSYKEVFIEFTPIIVDSDMDRTHFAVEHCFKDCKINILNKN